VRRQAGIALQRQDPMSYIAGLLVAGLEGIPDDHDVVVSEGDLYSLMFHQGNGRARLYLCPGRSGQRRFAGPDAARLFLAAWNPTSYPLSGDVSSAVPAGPCVTYPGDDTWTHEPYADGVILIGDAAGHNDPIIGQGLSNAMRDSRMVTDLILNGAGHLADFTGYGQERSERMRRERLLADVFAVTHAEDAGNRMARRQFLGEKVASLDPEVFPLLLGALAGPETIPDELVDQGILDRIRSA
jgi:2-polyprenyl-6-methoxyphenol hydroxylase-like FAD-dependent oxidoreductase